MRPIIFLATAVLIFVALATPFSAQAVWIPGQPVVPCGIDKEALKKPGMSAADLADIDKIPAEYAQDCDFNKLIQLAENIISIGIYLAILVAVAMFALAGWLYLTSAGDVGKMKQAHTVATNAVFGFVFVLAAWLIVYLILSALASETFCKSGAAKIIMNDSQVTECLDKFKK